MVNKARISQKARSHLFHNGVCALYLKASQPTADDGIQPALMLEGTSPHS